MRRLYSGLIRLHVLHHAGQEPIFGFGIMQELRRHGYHIGPGNHLSDAACDGEERAAGSTALKKDGRLQRAYRATGAGRRALTEAKEKCRSFSATCSRKSDRVPLVGDELGPQSGYRNRSSSVVERSVFSSRYLTMTGV